MSSASCLTCALLQCSRIARRPLSGTSPRWWPAGKVRAEPPGTARGQRACRAGVLSHAVRVLQPVAAGSRRRGAMVPLTRKRPAQSRFPRLSKVATVSTSCPSSSPQPDGSRRKGAGHRQFARRGTRAHRYRQTPDVGSWSRRSSTEAGSRLLRRAVTDWEGNRTERRTRLQLRRSA